MSLLQNSNAISSGGYDINNSLRFRASASASLSRTPASAGNRTTWTWSGWIKRGALGSNSVVFSANTGSIPNLQDYISFEASNSLSYYSVLQGTSVNIQLTTTQVFRDPSAWYHIILAVDTTQATASNRVKIYVNGLQVTAFSTATYPSLNYVTGMNATVIHTFAQSSSTAYFDGYMSEVNLVNGQALTPSSFGETDATTGVWKAKKYTGTYGTNGFYLPFTSNSNTAYAVYTTDINSNYHSLPTGSQGTNFTFSGDFTVEGWVLFPSNIADHSLYVSNSGSTYFALNIDVTNGVYNIYCNSSTPTSSFASGITVGNWTHVAMVRSGSTITLYTNGVAKGTITNSSTLGYSSLSINRFGGGNAGTRYMSNVRITKSAIYTANFVPPTTALTNVANTVVLTYQNSTAIDNSSNGYTLTATGSPSLFSGNLIWNANVVVDASGNKNHWTPNNLNYSFYGSTYDSMIDSPINTNSSGTRPIGNYAVWNPLDKDSATVLVDGNLKATGQNTGGVTSIALTSGKWYWETTLVDPYNGPQQYWGTHGVTSGKASGYNSIGSGAAGVFASIIGGLGGTYANGSLISGQTTWANGDVIGFAFDATNLTLDIYRNNTKIGTTLTVPSGAIFPTYNLSGTSGDTSTITSNFGQQPFTYTPPTGYQSICTTNLPDSTIKKGNKYMDATLYTGNGANRSLTNGGLFWPDLLWIKKRNASFNHRLNNTITGTSATLFTDSTSAETTWGGLDAFLANGFSVSNDASTNANGDTYVAWQWNAGSNSSSTNTVGSITSTVSRNTTAGFSVVTYTGNGTSGATVGHGLGVAPKMMIVKLRSGNASTLWFVYHQSMSSTPQNSYLQLQSTAALGTASSVWNNTAPTSSVFTLGNDSSSNANTNTYVAYCWAEIAGFSKFGSYTGNGSTDGPFIYLGFRPAFVMLKRTDTTDFWRIHDNKRLGYNADNNVLYPNSSAAEDSAQHLDLTSNGFKCRNTLYPNASGGTYIYAAFAENPFKNSNAR